METWNTLPELHILKFVKGHDVYKVGLWFSAVGGDSAPRGHQATTVSGTTGVGAPGIEWMGQECC